MSITRNTLALAGVCAVIGLVVQDAGPAAARRRARWSGGHGDGMHGAGHERQPRGRVRPWASMRQAAGQAAEARKAGATAECTAAVAKLMPTKDSTARGEVGVYAGGSGREEGRARGGVVHRPSDGRARLPHSRKG